MIMLKQAFVFVSMLLMAGVAGDDPVQRKCSRQCLQRPGDADRADALSSGTNSIIGTVGGTDQQDWGGFDRAGGNAIELAVSCVVFFDRQPGIYGSSRFSFVGSTTSAGSYTGYVHFGTGATNNGPATNLVGSDLMPLLATQVLPPARLVSLRLSARGHTRF